MLEHDNNQWAFEATVHCDSPYGYLTPQEFTYTVNGTSDIIVPCRSSANRPILPSDLSFGIHDAHVDDFLRVASVTDGVPTRWKVDSIANAKGVNF